MARLPPLALLSLALALAWLVAPARPQPSQNRLAAPADPTDTRACAGLVPEAAGDFPYTDEPDTHDLLDTDDPDTDDPDADDFTPDTNNFIPDSGDVTPSVSPAPHTASLANSTFHTAFHPLAETYAFLTALRAAHPCEVSLKRIGTSSQGRDILAAVLARPRLKRRKNGRWRLVKKPRILLLAAQHAREWIATSTALYLAHALVADLHEPSSQSALLDKFDFHILPVPNPDGYNHTWEEDRFWYKNMMPIANESACFGVDMNRYGFAWVPSSSAPDEGPCAPWYPGAAPFTAPEVAALATYARSIARLRAFVDLRSYGQMVSIPFSYSCATVPPDAEDLLEAALGAAAALRGVHGTQMTTGMLCETLYRAPGNVLDWVYAERRVKYSFAVHLRDTGTYGFALPPAWIRPVGEETAALVAYIAQFALERERIGGKGRAV